MVLRVCMLLCVLFLCVVHGLAAFVTASDAIMVMDVPAMGCYVLAQV